VIQPELGWGLGVGNHLIIQLMHGCESRKVVGEPEKS
jgi:hypothetical protein